MDNIIDILILKKDIDSVGIYEIFNEWGDEKISYEPPKYLYKNKLVFHQNFDMKYYEDIVTEEYDLEESISLTLEGESLSELEIELNQRQVNQSENELLVFLRHIFDILDKVCIVKLRNEEIIDEKHTVEDTDTTIKLFLKSLDWNSPKGIVITKFE